MNIKHYFFIITFFLCSLTTLLLPAKVEVHRRNIYVNGEVFIIRGVCYSPTPIGKSPAKNYFWWRDKNYLSDIPKIKKLGANVIRTYSAPQNYNSNFEEFLNECDKNGIYVIIGYWVKPGQNFAEPNIRNTEKQNFKEIVNQWKNYPAVIIWCFGNEVYPGSGSGWSDWYSLVQEVAQEVKAIDNNHLVMTATNVDYFYGTVGQQTYKSDDNSLSSVDLWGINAYLGYDFKDLFYNYSQKSSKPLIITEFGCDSWDGRFKKEDEDMQASYIVSQWKGIERNLTLENGVVSGGCVFEWSDEWWKSFSNTLGDAKQDTSTDWTNYAYEDPNINEEWFGIMKISSDTYNTHITTPKKSYYELRKLWNKSVLTEENNVYAYPNPAKNCEFVRFSLLPYGAEEINIYNIAGELVKTINVKDVFDTRWYLDNNYNQKVASGIYIFIVKTREGIAKNKIVVIK